MLLPETPVDEGEQVLTRLQRSLTGGLFMHKDKQVFVTFSAGVTGYRLERADRGRARARRPGALRSQADREEPHLHRLRHRRPRAFGG